MSVAKLFRLFAKTPQILKVMHLCTIKKATLDGVVVLYDRTTLGKQITFFEDNLSTQESDETF
jgi:hypothetical protein